MILTLFMALTIASWIYWVVAWWLVRIFFNSRPTYDLEFAPPVSVLKPVKGLDHQAYENFASFCQQDYPEYELLFAVADPADEAVSVIEQIRQENPQIKIRIIVAPDHGTNHKASLLHSLAQQAEYEFLVASDSDMRVTPDYLRRVVAPLDDPHVGLVTCPYKGEEPLTFTARLEALHMGVTFLPSVLVGRRVLKMRFAMGATEALRKEELDRIGGFAAIADYLADDYQLGVRIADLGLRVHLSDYIVASILGATTFPEQWHREVRWAHCNRVSRTLEYPGILLSFSTPLAFTTLLISAFSHLGWWALVTSLTLRWTVGWLIAGNTDDQEGRRWLFWLPVRDMLSALIWCAGFFGRRVTWRGEQFVLRSDGRLVSVKPHQEEASFSGTRTLLRKAIIDLDAYLRNYYNIYEFCYDEDCILRLSITTSDRDLTLSDGTRIHKGELIGELFFWNEHIPFVPEAGPNLAWAITFQRRVTYSLRELASHVNHVRIFEDISAFRSNPPFGDRLGHLEAVKLVERWGFDVVEKDHTGGLRGYLSNFWGTVYTTGIIWAYNPASLAGKQLWRLNQDQLWISRSMLIKKYGAEEKSA
jgi:ceramide glucosyltransferase